MKPLIALLLSLFLLLLSLDAKAQQPLFRHYSVDEGIPSSEVYQSVQDSRGYLWFATDRGVARFDGHRFKVFTTANGLTDNTVLGFFKDKLGRIWLQNFSGKLSYFEGDQLHHVNENPNSLSYQNAIYANKDTVWYNSNHVSEDTRIYYTDLKTGKNGEYRQPQSNFHTLFFNSRENGVQFGPDSLILTNKKFSFGAGRFKIYYDRKQINRLVFKNAIQRAIQVGPDLFLSGNLNMIYLLGPNGLVVERVLPKQFITLFQDEDGSIWVGLFKGGIYRFKTYQELIDFFSKKGAGYEEHFLKNESVSSISRDSEGGLWFTTLESGVYYTPSIQTRCYTTRDGLLEDKVAHIMLKKPGEMLANLHGGQLLAIQDKKIEQIEGVEDPYSVHGFLIKRLNNKIWYTKYSGVYELGDDNRLEHFLLSGYVLAHWQKNEEESWIFNYEGLTHLRGKKIEAIYPPGPIPRITAICGSNDSLWLGTLTGLYVLDKGKYVSMAPKEPLLSARVTAMSSSGSSLWIATHGSGIIIRQNGKNYTIRTNNGLASDLCNTLFLESDSVMWVSSFLGVSRIAFTTSPFSYSVKNYTTANGLISNEVNDVSIDGDFLWVATNKGISVLNTKTFEKAIAPPIYITCVKANGHDLNGTHKLEHNANSLHFQFVGIAFRDAGRLKYKYQLVGHDNTWKYTSQPEVQFNNLHPGNYIFKVVAYTASGQSEVPAIYSFTIRTAWYSSSWFILLVIALILLLIAVGFKLVVGMEKRKSTARVELNKRIAQLELRSLQSQMNPHFIFNALNSIQKFIGRNDQDSAYRYLAKFGSLIRSILNNPSTGFHTVQEEIALLELYLQLETLRMDHNLSYSILVDPHINPENILLPTMIIQPFVENAVWHGIMPLKGKGHITITLELLNKQLSCTIRDNGIGRKAAEALKATRQSTHKSTGMKITQERLAMLSLTEDLSSHISISDLEGSNESGTIVELILPIKYQVDENH